MTIQKNKTRQPLSMAEQAADIANQAHDVVYQTRALLSTAMSIALELGVGSEIDNFHHSRLICQLDAIQALLEKNETIFSDAELFFSKERK